MQFENNPESRSGFTGTACNTRDLKFFNPEKSIGAAMTQFCRCRYVRESVSDKRVNENFNGFISISKSKSVPAVSFDNSSSIRLEPLAIPLEINLSMTPQCLSLNGKFSRIEWMTAP
jgi:hypothetical protein